MKKVFALLMILFCTFQLRAQNAVNEKVATKKTVSLALNQKFSSKVLNAYQENSKSKVDDLFYYFQLLTDASLTDDLKKEIVKNINLLYKNHNVTVIDFTSPTLDKILLNQFLEKLLISEPILFTVANQTKYNAVDYESWKISYTVAISKSGLQNKIPVAQKVYFMEMVKQFGDEKKEIMETYFGEME